MINIRDEMCDHFSNMDLDIRRTNFGRFTDQKNTPDIVSFIADCIVNYIGSESGKKFTVKDIWKSRYFEKIVTEYLQQTKSNGHSNSE